jgi:hypothetical protein
MMLEQAGHSGGAAGRRPGAPKVAHRVAQHGRRALRTGPERPRPAQVREHVRNDTAHLALEGLHPPHLRREHAVQLVARVHFPAVAVLRRAHVEAERPGFEVGLPALERENLVPAPAVRKREGDCGPEELAADPLKLRGFERPDPRHRLSELATGPLPLPLPCVGLASGRRDRSERSGEEGAPRDPVSTLDSLDHLIRPLEERRRDRQTEGVGSLEVDNEFELRRLFDGDVTGLGAFQDLIHVEGGAS